MSCKLSEEQFAKQVLRRLDRISHEIRNPVYCISRLATLLLQSDLTPEQRRQILMLQTSINQLTALLDDLQDPTGMEENIFSMRPRYFQLQQALFDILETQQPLAQQNGLTLKCQIDPDVPDELYGDPQRLQQIIVNLTRNAIKYTPAGHVFVRISGEFFLSKSHIQQAVSPQQEERVELTIQVCDTGQGISPNCLARVFEHSENPKSPENDHSLPSQDLGLAITAELAKHMGGYIWVESEPGVGSCFQVILPFTLGDVSKRYAQNLANTSESSILHAATAIRRPLHILLVENNIIARQIGETWLHELGYQVCIADTGEQALQLFQEHAFDFILTDRYLPHLDGLQLVAKIREQEKQTDRHIPIVMLTAAASLSELQHCLAQGADAYLTKPFTQGQLNHVIHYTLQRLEKRTQQQTQPAQSSTFYEKILANLDGHQSLCQNVISRCLKLIPETMNRLGEATQKQELDRLLLIIHQFKGSLGYIAKEEPVYEQLQGWERILKQSQVTRTWDSRIESTFREFELSVAQLLNDLQDIVRAQALPELKPESVH